MTLSTLTKLPKLSVERMSQQFPALLRNIWLLPFAIVSFSVLSDWIQCICTRSLSDNIIPLLAIVALLVAFKRYKSYQPPFTENIHLAGVVLFCIASLLIATGDYLHFSRITWIGFILIAGGVTLSKGYSVFKHWSAPLLVTLFILPGAPLAVVDQISANLQGISTKTALFISQIFIPISVKQYTFYVNGEAFEVGTACCGLSMITSVCFLILLWNLYRPVKVKMLILQLVAGVVLSISMNGLRIAIVAILAYFVSRDFAIEAHSILELPLFIIAIGIMWFIVSKSNSEFESQTANTVESVRNSTKNIVCSIVMFLVLLLPVYVILTNPSVDSKHTRVLIPTEFGKWEGKDIDWTEMMRKNYKYTDANITWRKYKSTGNPPVYCFVQQASNYENIHDVFACLKLVGASPTCIRTGVLKVSPDKSVPFSVYEYTYKDVHFNTMFLYQSKISSAIYPAMSFGDKLKIAVAGRIPCRLIELSTPSKGSQTEAFSRLKELASELADVPI